jgi:hypothetical protein
MDYGVYHCLAVAATHKVHGRTLHHDPMHRGAVSHAQHRGMLFAVRDDEIHDVPIISPPKIESLTLLNSSSVEILAFITLPALLYLNVMDADIDDEVDNDVFDSFLFRSAPPLRKFVVLGDLESLLPALFAIPSLIDLQIWHPTFPITQSLFTSLRDTALLPRLQNLSFLGCREGEDEADLEDIVEMAAEPLTNRMDSPNAFAPLQSFRVVSKSRRRPGPFSRKDLLPYKKLKARGVDVHIGTEKRSVV